MECLNNDIRRNSMSALKLLRPKALTLYLLFSLIKLANLNTTKMIYVEEVSVSDQFRSNGNDSLLLLFIIYKDSIIL